MEESFEFPASVTPDEGGRFRARFPDLPEAWAEGGTHGEALVDATRSLTEAIAARIAAGEPIPLPSPLLGNHQIVKPAPHIIHQAIRHCGGEAVSL